MEMEIPLNSPGIKIFSGIRGIRSRFLYSTGPFIFTAITARNRNATKMNSCSENNLDSGVEISEKLFPRTC